MDMDSSLSKSSFNKIQKMESQYLERAHKRTMDNMMACSNAFKKKNGSSCSNASYSLYERVRAGYSQQLRRKAVRCATCQTYGYSYRCIAFVSPEQPSLEHLTVVPKVRWIEKQFTVDCEWQKNVFDRPCGWVGRRSSTQVDKALLEARENGGKATKSGLRALMY